MPYDRFKHHRRSLRLPGYDYTQAGSYFVTIVTHNRECLFGEISDGRMQLNEMGRVVEEEWSQSARVRPNVELDAFMVMPNHLHGIIVITGEMVGADGMEGANRMVGAQRRCAPTETCGPTVQPNSLGAIIRSFKSAVTKHINAIRDTQGALVWQRNYFEHVIRNEEELMRVRAYIASNPACWATDQENLR